MTEGPMPTARARSVSKDRKMEGLRPAQPSRRVQVFNLEQDEPQEHLMDSPENETEMVSSADEWNED